MFKQTSITAALAVGALLAPAAAQADVAKGVSAVKAHTTKADKALDRAVALYEANADARADRSFAESRREMGAATSAAAKLRRQAGTAAEKAAAARAQDLVASEQDENVEKLTGVLDEAEGRSESRIASAAAADVRGREKALGVLSALVDEVPEQARSGLARAIAGLSTGRDEEIEAQAEALVDPDVSSKSKETVVRSVETSVNGQVKAAERLADLTGRDDVPEEGKAGLRKAYAAVTAEHGSVADLLSRFSERMPERIRAFVGAVTTKARGDAQSMQDSRPAPPSGQPEVTQQADGTQSGQPEGTQSAQPESTPTGPTSPDRPEPSTRP